MKEIHKTEVRVIMDYTFYFLDKYIEDYDDTNIPNLALLAKIIYGIQKMVSSIEYEEIYQALENLVGPKLAKEILNKYSCSHIHEE